MQSLVEITNAFQTVGFYGVHANTAAGIPHEVLCRRWGGGCTRGLIAVGGCLAQRREATRQKCRSTLLGAYTPVGIALGHDVDVLLHGLLLGHSLDAVPRVPLGARLHLHGPRLRSLDVADSGLRERSMQRCEQSRCSKRTAGGCLLEQLVPARKSVSFRGTKAHRHKCPHIRSFSSLVASGLGGEFLMNLEHYRACEGWVCRVPNKGD